MPNLSFELTSKAGQVPPCAPTPTRLGAFTMKSQAIQAGRGGAWRGGTWRGVAGRGGGVAWVDRTWQEIGSSRAPPSFKRPTCRSDPECEGRRPEAGGRRAQPMTRSAPWPVIPGYTLYTRHDSTGSGPRSAQPVDADPMGKLPAEITVSDWSDGQGRGGQGRAGEGGVS